MAHAAHYLALVESIRLCMWDADCVRDGPEPGKVTNDGTIVADFLNDHIESVHIAPGGQAAVLESQFNNSKANGSTVSHENLVNGFIERANVPAALDEESSMLEKSVSGKMFDSEWWRNKKASWVKYLQQKDAADASASKSKRSAKSSAPSSWNSSSSSRSSRKGRRGIPNTKPCCCAEVGNAIFLRAEFEEHYLTWAEYEDFFKDSSPILALDYRDGNLQLTMESPKGVAHLEVNVQHLFFGARDTLQSALETSDGRRPASRDHRKQLKRFLQEKAWLGFFAEPAESESHYKHSVSTSGGYRFVEVTTQGAPEYRAPGYPHGHLNYDGQPHEEQEMLKLVPQICLPFGDGPMYNYNQERPEDAHYVQPGDAARLEDSESEVDIACPWVAPEYAPREREKGYQMYQELTIVEREVRRRLQLLSYQAPQFFYFTNGNPRICSDEPQNDPHVISMGDIWKTFTYLEEKSHRPKEWTTTQQWQFVGGAWRREYELWSKTFKYTEPYAGWEKEESAHYQGVFVSKHLVDAGSGPPPPQVDENIFFEEVDLLTGEPAWWCCRPKYIGECIKILRDHGEPEEKPYIGKFGPCPQENINGNRSSDYDRDFVQVRNLREEQRLLNRWNADPQARLYFAKHVTPPINGRKCETTKALVAAENDPRCCKNHDGFIVDYYVQWS